MDHNGYVGKRILHALVLLKRMANARDVAVLGMAKVAVDSNVGHALAFTASGASRHVTAAVVAGFALVAGCLSAHVFETRQTLAREFVGA